jgi:glycine/D-amino acid oxidase-like deaminating enzyme
MARRSRAINAIESLAHDLQINCQFRRVPGYLHAAIGGERDESNELRAEAELAPELGFDAEFLEFAPIVSRPGIRFPNQAKFHPLEYLAGLACAIKGDGSAIFEQSEVTDVQPLAVKIGDSRILFDHVIVATHVPMMDKTPLAAAILLQTKLASYTSYVVGGTIPRNSLPEISLWDTAQPYHYLRVDSGKKQDFVIFGGGDKKTGQESNTKIVSSTWKTRCTK